MLSLVQRLTAMSSRRWLFVLVVLFAAVVVSGAADQRRAEPIAVVEPGVREEAVRIDVLVVRASKGAVFLDPALARMGKHLALTKHDGFAVVDRDESELTDGEHDEFQFGLRTFRIDLKEHDGKSARLRLRLFGDDRKPRCGMVKSRRRIVG